MLPAFIFHHMKLKVKLKKKLKMVGLKCYNLFKQLACLYNLRYFLPLLTKKPVSEADYFSGRDLEQLLALVNLEHAGLIKNQLV